MSFFKQKISPQNYFATMLKEVLTNSAIYPNSDALQEQDKYSSIELERIKTEQVKLAVVYVLLSVLELNKDTAKIHDVKMTYASVLIRVVQDHTTEISDNGIKVSDFLDTVDGYTAYIAQKSSERKTKSGDDYYFAFQHFQDVVFKERTLLERPISSITLAKVVRHMIEELNKDLLSRYKIVF